MKLIITDLDNTLLKSDKSISEYTADVLRRCKNKGHLIAFATARSEAAISRFVELIKPDIVVSNGGAQVRLGDELIYRNMMSAEDVSRIIEMCYRFTDGKALITMDREDGYYCNFKPNDPDRYNGYVHSDFKELEGEAYKITAGLEDPAWGEEIARCCPDCVYMTFTGEIWRGFNAKNSDKQTALRMIVSRLGLELDDVIAFGDDKNDLEMLRLAGVGVAVSNAIDEVRKIADFITDSNDKDGVARFLEKNILI